MALGEGGGGFGIGESVYHSLRRNIVNLRLKPGEALNIKSIAIKLGVSRTPVRDAILRLAKEGLVDVMPQRGTRVSLIDSDRVEEERFVRACLEERVLELFLDSYSSGEQVRLANNLELQKECQKAGDPLSFLEHDDAFHGIFFQAVGKLLSWELIQNLSGHYRRVRLLSLMDRDLLGEIINEHSGLLACILRSDRMGALNAARSHASKVTEVAKKLSIVYPDYFKVRTKIDFLLNDFIHLNGGGTLNGKGV